LIFAFFKFADPKSVAALVDELGQASTLALFSVLLIKLNDAEATLSHVSAPRVAPEAGVLSLLTSEYMAMDRPICLRLLKHWVRRAFSRAAANAGSSMAAKMPMIAMTTNSSISVKPPIFSFKNFLMMMSP